MIMRSNAIRGAGYFADYSPRLFESLNVIHPLRIGAPNWIIEIVSPGSRRMDYYIKLFKYRTAGVREYWIVDPEKKHYCI